VGGRTEPMKLTRASNYALHAVAYLAAKKSDKPIASHTIARACGIFERFLLKVLKPLVSIRVLSSIKGPHGGYQLAKPPREITLLEIIQAANDSEICGETPFTDKKNPALNKKISAVCTHAADLVRDYLEKTRLSDLLGKK
jgi:Rrf2 family protein